VRPIANSKYLTAHNNVRFTTEMKNESAGLLAAAFIGIAPGYISRSVAGSYDNEAISIFLLMFTFFLWIKALKTGSALYGTIAAIFYFYMVSAWGAFIPPLGPVPYADECDRWIRFHHQHDSSSRSGSHAHGSFLIASIRRLLLLVRHWHSRKYASALRRIPASQH
jgi:hypothetical protein